jgi:hypothetical protein
VSRQTGIYCVLCDRQGIMDSMMIQHQAKGGILTCSVQNHQIEYSKLMAMKPRMVRLQITEKQPQNTVVQQVWVYPEVLTALRERFPTNLMTTLCAIMTAISDPDTIMIEGENARKLRELGVHKGSDVIGLAEAQKSTQEAMEKLRADVKAFEPMMKLVAALTGNNPAVAEMMGGLQAGGAGATPPKSTVGIGLHAPGDYEPSEDELAMAEQQQQEALVAGRRARAGIEFYPDGRPKPIPSGR